MAAGDALAQAILDTALRLGEESGWERLRLVDVALAMGVRLDDIRRHYPQKDDLVEAWFDRADRALLGTVPDPDLLTLPAPARIEAVIMAWLDALASHRRLTGQMLLYKLEFGHVHLQALGITRISRTVQWFREAAALQAADLERIVQELALTTLYLATFAHWLRDDSPDSTATRTFLQRQLGRGQTLKLWR